MHFFFEGILLFGVMVRRNEEERKKSVVMATKYADTGTGAKIPATCCAIVRCGKEKLSYKRTDAMACTYVFVRLKAIEKTKLSITGADNSIYY